MPSEAKEVQTRLTFEDTLVNQKKIRNWLEILIKQKKPLEWQQRDAFIKIFNKATLTIGRPKLVIYKAPDGKRIPLGKLHYFAQKITYIKTNTIIIKYKNKSYTIPIEDLWKLLLEYLLEIFPASLDLALRMSAERFRTSYKGSVDYYPSTRWHKENNE